MNRGERKLLVEIVFEFSFRFVDQRVAVDGNFHTLTLLTSAEHSGKEREEENAKRFEKTA